MTNQLLSRGYEFSYLRKVVNMVTNLDKSSIIQYKERQINKNFIDSIFFQMAFSMNFPNIKQILNTSWSNVVKSDSALDKFKLNIVNNMEPNISSLLVHNFKFQPFINFKYSSCSSPYCKICSFSCQYKYIFLNNFYFPILSNSSCNSEKVIYIILCKCCNSIYVGQTSKSAKIRLNQHLNDIKRFIPFKERNSCVATHFNLKGHNYKKNFVFFIFKKDLEDQIRLNLETQIIHLFLRIKVKVLNDYIPKLNISSSKIFT